MGDEISLQTPQKATDTYSLSTPYGILTISQGGRRVTFELYADVRQSMHNTALFTYVQQLKRQGVTRFNTDHVNIPERDRTLSLIRGKAKLDLVYEYRGKTFECELKTGREIGLDITARQITEFVKWCDHLTLLVPRGCLEEAAIILNMINLDGHVTITPYDWVEDEE